MTELSRCSSFEVIADLVDFDDVCVAKQFRKDFDSVALLGSCPSLMFYARCAGSVVELQSGSLPIGLPRMAIYHSFLGTLLKGEIQHLYLILSPKTAIKAMFKLTGHETVFTVPLLSAEDDKRGVYPVSAFSSGKGVGSFKGGHMSWQFGLMKLSIISTDENLTIPEGCRQQLAAMNCESVSVYGFGDIRFVRVFGRGTTSVSTFSLKDAPRLSSSSYHYVDFTPVLLTK